MRPQNEIHPRDFRLDFTHGHNMPVFLLSVSIQCRRSSVNSKFRFDNFHMRLLNCFYKYLGPEYLPYVTVCELYLCFACGGNGKSVLSDLL